MSNADTLFVGLCDDAAVFPPGNLPLAQAAPAHTRHEAAPYAEIVGPFVLAATDLDDLARLVADLEPGALRLSVTTPLPRVGATFATVERIPAVRLSSVEVGVPDGVAPEVVVPALDQALAGHELPVFVELPRDDRRTPLVNALAGTAYQAKLRTGGVRADLYPDGVELATTVVQLVAAGVSFKATAGLHHAVRNTDPETGFEQHGFLNMMVATQAAADGANATEVAGLLAERDPEQVVSAVHRLEPSVRQWFRSFGTCSVTEPVEDLVALGLLPRDYLVRVS